MLWLQEIVFLHLITRDAVGPFLRGVGTDPNGVDLLDFFVVGFCEDGAVLAGYHPATVIDGTF